MDPICDVTTTGDDQHWLVDIARQLVDDRLVACGNIATTKVRSVYRWEGKVEEADEYTLVLHTRTSLAEEVIRRTVEAHPYDNPQVLATRVILASPTYQQWVIDSTREP